MLAPPPVTHPSFYVIAVSFFFLSSLRGVARLCVFWLCCFCWMLAPLFWTVPEDSPRQSPENAPPASCRDDPRILQDFPKPSARQSFRDGPKM